MSLFGMVFGASKGDDVKLEEQRDKLSEIHESLKIASDEITMIKNQLVSKANGSFYPYLAKAGAKARET